MFNRVTLRSYFMNGEDEVSSTTFFGSTLPLHGATKTSRELEIGKSYTLDLKPNHLGMGYVLSSTDDVTVTLKRHSPIDADVVLTKSTGKYHLFHRVLGVDEKLNTAYTYSLTVENTAGLILKFACHYT